MKGATLGWARRRLIGCGNLSGGLRFVMVRTNVGAGEAARGTTAHLPTPTAGATPRLLADIKQRVQQAQVRAMLSVNAELIRLYWGIGQVIDERQRQEGWGAGVIARLARDLHNELPEEKGFSERNIKQMLAF